MAGILTSAVTKKGALTRSLQEKLDTASQEIASSIKVLSISVSGLRVFHAMMT